MRTRYVASVAALAAAGTLLTGATGAHAAGFDDTFGVTGTVFNPLHASGDRYLGATRAPGGGTYNVGYTTAAGADRAIVVTRVDAAGELVSSFGTGGVVTINAVAPPFAAPPAGTTPTGTGETGREVLVQSDGKIVVVGQAETVAGKPDSRDTDIYVARLNANGALDGTFGTGGIKRVDLSNGVGAGNTVNGDQVYGGALRPDDKIVLFGSKGLDSAEPARTDRDIVAVQLLANGDPDPAFGTAGVATTRNAGVSENPRHGLIQADGKVIATGYGTGIGNVVRPFIYRFNADGTSDATFGTGGVATGEVGGPGPGFAEVYDVVQQGDKYVFTGYGSRSTTPANGIDALLYRFNADGSWDRTFGQDGLFTWNRTGGADRGRALTSLSDGRLVVVGSTATAATETVPAVLDGLILVVKPDGSGPDTSVGSSGALIRDLGGINDAYFGVTTVANGTKVVAAGFRAGADSNLDDSALTRADLPPAVAGPVGPAGPAGANGADGAPGPSLNAAPGAAGPAGPAGPRGAAGRSIRRVTVSCKLTGKKKNKVSCTTKLTRTTSGAVKLRLAKSGKVVASGSAKARNGKAAIALKGKAGKGTYTLRGSAGGETFTISVTLR